MKCGGFKFSFLLVNMGVRQGYILILSLFSTCMEWILGKTVNQSLWGIHWQQQGYPIFANDAVLLTESFSPGVGCQGGQSPWDSRSPSPKARFRYMDAYQMTEQSVCVCGKTTEILDYFTYLCSIVQRSGGSGHGVSWWTGLVHDIMNSLDMSIGHCQYLCQRTKIQIFKMIVLTVLLIGCEAWTLTRNL